MRTFIKFFFIFFCFNLIANDDEDENEEEKLNKQIIYLKTLKKEYTTKLLEINENENADEELKNYANYLLSTVQFSLKTTLKEQKNRRIQEKINSLKLNAAEMQNLKADIDLIEDYVKKDYDDEKYFSIELKLEDAIKIFEFFYEIKDLDFCYNFFSNVINELKLNKDNNEINQEYFDPIIEQHKKFFGEFITETARPYLKILILNEDFNPANLQISLKTTYLQILEIILTEESELEKKLKNLKYFSSLFDHFKFNCKIFLSYFLNNEEFDYLTKEKFEALDLYDFSHFEKNLFCFKIFMESEENTDFTHLKLENFKTYQNQCNIVYGEILGDIIYGQVDGQVAIQENLEQRLEPDLSPFIFRDLVDRDNMMNFLHGHRFPLDDTQGLIPNMLDFLQGHELPLDDDTFPSLNTVEDRHDPNEPPLINTIRLRNDDKNDSKPKPVKPKKTSQPKVNSKNTKKDEQKIYFSFGVSVNFEVYQVPCLISIDSAGFKGALGLDLSFLQILVGAEYCEKLQTIVCILLKRKKGYVMVSISECSFKIGIGIDLNILKNTFVNFNCLVN